MTVTRASGATTRDERNPAGGGDGHLGERGDERGMSGSLLAVNREWVAWRR